VATLVTIIWPRRVEEADPDYSTRTEVEACSSDFGAEECGVDGQTVGAGINDNARNVEYIRADGRWFRSRATLFRLTPSFVLIVSLVPSS
jgi:hypothetical protein